jgi:RimJ/RimL family protein N-acetyltransferase
MKPAERLETERLILRQPRMDDAPVIFTAYRQDPAVTRYTTWRAHQRLQDMAREGLRRKYILRSNTSHIPRDSYMYAITKQTTEERC